MLMPSVSLVCSASLFEFLADAVLVHFLTSVAFEQVTGIAAPPSQISRRTYGEQGYPWFSLYDEHLPAARIDTSTLRAVTPLDQFDDEKSKRKRDLNDPTSCIGCSDKAE